MFRAAEMGQQLFALTFVQAENWVDVGAAVAIFGEEAGNRFRRMVGADHHPFGHSGDAVLGLHPLTGFFVTANKVAQFDPRFAERLFTGQYRGFDIHRQHPVRLDKGDGVLAVLLIRLYAIGQPNGNKLQAAVARFGTQFINRHLAQFPRQGGVLAAADTQHQRFNKRVGLQVGLQEIDAAADLAGDINLRLCAQRLNNLLL